MVILHFLTSLIRGSPGGPYIMTYGIRSPTGGSDQESTAKHSLKIHMMIITG